jgi:hypothetical protein
MWLLPFLPMYESFSYIILCNETLNKTYQPTAAKMVLLSGAKRDFLSSTYYFGYLVFIQLRYYNSKIHFYRKRLDTFCFLFFNGNNCHYHKNVLPYNGYQILREGHQY